MAPSLKVRLLGEFQLNYDGQSVKAIDSVRLQSLCAYLASRPEISHSRARLAFSFWQNSTEKQALTNLRHILHKLRNALPEAERFVQIDAKTINWKADPDFYCDVSTFEKHLKLATEANQKDDLSSTLSNLSAASEIYKGDLLPGFYEDWIDIERDRLRQEYATALISLIKIHEDRRDYNAAIDIAERWRIHEPAHEAAYFKLMSLYALAGDRSAALKTYHRCESVLHQELDVAPSRETQELRERLQQSETRIEDASLVEMPDDDLKLPLQGRLNEWKQLRDLWTKARAGCAHLVSLNGEAGIGKTRLAEELCYWVEAQGGSTARSRSYSAEGRLAYGPVMQWLRSAFLFPQILNLNREWQREVSRILPELKSKLPVSAEEASLKPPTLQRQHLFEALSRALLFSGKPLLLLLDDMQWTDEETLQWLAFLFRFAPKAKLLVVATIRQEEIDENPFLRDFLLDMRREDFASEMTLAPLQATETLSIAESIAGRRLTPGEVSLLHAETEGNPLFIVESVRAVMEDDERGFPRLPKPFEAKQIVPKVQAIIAKRFSLLRDEGREFANIAAVMGREFSFEGLVQVWGKSEDLGAEALDELLRHRIVEEREESLYDFTHDKLREVAYIEIPSHRKRILHRKTAECLESFGRGKADLGASQIAAHYEHAGKYEDAISFYRKAAENALNVHAENESARLYEKALHLINLLPNNQQRDELELQLSTDLGTVLVAVRGYTASEALKIYKRARVLCKRLGRPSEPPIIRGLALHHLTNGQLQSSLTLGFELLQRYEETKEPIIAVEGDYTLGVAYFWLGQFEKARIYLERSIKRYDPNLSGIHISRYAQDPKAVCLCRLAWTLLYLGFPDHAMKRMEEAVEFVSKIDHHHTKAYVYHFGAQAYADFGMLDRAQELIGRFSELVDDSDFIFWEARGNVLKIYVEASINKDVSRLDEISTMLQHFPESRGPINLSNHFASLAHFCLDHGRIDEGLDSIEHGFALLNKIDERFSVMELHRIKGELLKTKEENVDLVESHFKKALKISQDSKAKTIELRAATSLAKLWDEQGKRKEAKQLLKSVFAWFAEGFDTRDLKNAKVLLEEWD